VSFDIPEYTSDVTGVGTIRILEAIREAGLRSRFYQASSSEMFGKAQETPQTEKTPFWPRQFGNSSQRSPRNLPSSWILAPETNLDGALDTTQECWFQIASSPPRKLVY
jgi:hypothetical protein